MVMVSPLDFGQPVATLARAITAVTEISLPDGMEVARVTLARRGPATVDASVAP
jgi:hypothetical protein